MFWEFYMVAWLFCRKIAPVQKFLRRGNLRDRLRRWYLGPRWKPRSYDSESGQGHDASFKAVEAWEELVDSVELGASLQSAILRFNCIT